MRFKTFPRYLVVHMQRYVQKPDWTIGKLSVEVDQSRCLPSLQASLLCLPTPPLSVQVPVPEALDLTALRATGLQPRCAPFQSLLELWVSAD